jgi:predicted DNA-binding protein
MEEAMVQISFRTDEELKEELKLEVIRSGKTQNAVINEALHTHLESERAALEKIKQAVTSGRAEGRRSRGESLQLANKTADLDDREGLGVIKTPRRESGRSVKSGQ